jgi:hypothetical protein
MAGPTSVDTDDLGTVEVEPGPAAESLKRGDGVSLMARPQAVQILPADGSTGIRVLSRIAMGPEYEYLLELKTGRRWRARTGSGQIAPGCEVSVRLAPGGAAVYRAADAPGSAED